MVSIPTLWRPLVVVVTGCTIAAVACAGPLPPAQTGLASIYSDELQGKRTASGDHYDRSALTAAHRTLPLGTEVRITNLDNGKSVRIRINDRGPHVRARIIDLSARAAAALGMRSGVTRVKLEVISQPKTTAAESRADG